jgi:hypothetical protein
MATIHLSHDLAEHTGGLDAIEIDAPRVHEMLVALAARFPGLDGIVREMAVAIDGEIHQDATYHALEPDSDVHFVPRIVGG